MAQSRRPSVLTRSAPSTMLRGNLYTAVRHEGKLTAYNTERWGATVSYKDNVDPHLLRWSALVGGGTASDGVAKCDALG